MSNIDVTKRDGSIENFDIEKLSDSIMNAALVVGGEDYDLANEIAGNILDILESNEIDDITTEDLQNIVEKTLIEGGHAATAKEYILKAADRNRMREMDSALMRSFEEITFKSEADSEVKRENANIDSTTAMGTMLKYGSEAAKSFNLLYMMSDDIANAHRNCDIHIHDLDFFALTETCNQLPIDRLFKHGFNTGHGFLREPGGIRTAGALAAIAIQSNQNDQHGGQSIPMFDYYLAPYVSLTFLKQIAHLWKISHNITRHVAKPDKENEKNTVVYKQLKNMLVKYWEKNIRIVSDPDWVEHDTVMDDKHIAELKKLIIDFLKERDCKVYKTEINRLFNQAYDETYDETFQAMEAFIHNLNTMHSRAGAQVPFSSINYGTCTTVEGRMIMETILNTTWDGLGNGETPIFPIQILKLKNGIDMDPGDPNYDIFELACKVSAKRLYPNFVNLDAPYNAELYVEGHPETEMATMGCRTRVGGNIHDPSKSVIPGRGNLSFTSINLPRLGILAQGDVNKFYKLLDQKLELVHRQLLERFEIQCQKHPINYPFLMGQGLWLGTEQLGPTDDIREALKNGTLTVGFIGLAETLVALTGKHHGESEESQKLGLEIVQHMRDYTDAWSQDEHMNYSVIGTPAEGLSGRFVRADKKLFGTIPGVTDKDYYTNSSHIPVSYPISAFKKVELEAPFHSIENGGHILYIEMDGDPTKNLKAFKKVVKYMHDKNAGYFAINHPVDRDSVCGYVGIINDVCPRCGRREGEPMTMEMWNKLHGYMGAGNADTLGACGNPEEEQDRVANPIDTTSVKFQRRSK